MTAKIDSVLTESRIFSAEPEFKQQANIQDDALYNQAEENRLQFWNDQAKNLHWFSPWETTLEWNRPYAKWFKEGTLNACYNCLDVHLTTHRKNKTAIIWEGDDGKKTNLTYQQLWEEVTIAAAILKNKFGVHKGDRVTIYMPMIPDTIIMVLACARLGAIHSVVFAGFSAQALYDRILDSESKLVITSFGGYRRGNVLNLKSTVDNALNIGRNTVESVLCISHLKEAAEYQWDNDRDYLYDTIKPNYTPGIDAEIMNSEDTLFILYTSGTTGKPKGIIHTTGGYLTHAKYSTNAVFDLKDKDVYWCTADIGWITGHTYLIYGPLSNGATIFIYEGTPDYPNKSRYWSLIDQYKVSILYTAPTAIRMFMKWGDSFINKYQLSSLRLLGSVGEPINPEAWVWYYNVIGKKRCPIVDTWWQTETGGILISNIPSVNNMKPGSAGLPLPGIKVGILTEKGDLVHEGGGLLSITEPWPSMLRGIWNDSQRFQSVYWDKFNTYFSGDSATKDSNGYYKVLGRIDDVINCAGHRIGTMEVESALVDHPSVAEAAVIGAQDDIKGQSIIAFVILKEEFHPEKILESIIKDHVSKQISAIAKPKTIIFTPELPKTRSGKIMRRILKALIENTPTGDISTLSNPNIVEVIQSKINTK